jgi:hypothetical protein
LNTVSKITGSFFSPFFIFTLPRLPDGQGQAQGLN